MVVGSVAEHKNNQLLVVGPAKVEWFSTSPAKHVVVCTVNSCRSYTIRLILQQFRQAQYIVASLTPTLLLVSQLH